MTDTMSRRQIDELSGALGRSELVRRIDLLQAEYGASRHDFAVAMLDIDHLKTVNDVYGHAAGDEVIRTVARRAGHVLRTTDELFRYGGDEFVVLLPATSLGEAAAVLRRVRDNIIGDPIDAGQMLTVTVSIGVAASSEFGDLDVTDTLLRADRRLFQAKRAGRNSLITEDSSEETGFNLGFAQTRLFGRDQQLNQVDAFLESTPTSAAERVLRVSGPPGIGLSRFLEEISIRASLAGRIVRQISALPANRALHLRSLELAYRDELSADASAEAIRTRLLNDAEAHGLVILLEDGHNLDPSSRRLLTERLARTGIWLVEAVVRGKQATYLADTSFSLPPLEHTDAVSWLGAATAGPIEPATAQALTDTTSGLPGRLSKLVLKLMAENILKPTPAGLAGDPALIREYGALLAASDDTPNVNLPVWDSTLLGRNQFLEFVQPTAHAARLLVLTGPGGIGKSRLAAQLALQLSGEMPDGTDWIDLRAVQEADHLLRKLTQTLDLEATDETGSIIRQLAGQKRLLVFDEADGVAGSAGVFSELLSGLPELRILITSRMPLRLPEETVVEVPVLMDSAARELFMQGMDRHGADAADDGIEELLTAIGNTPLSVELAAAWTRVFTPLELKNALDNQPELLVEAPGLQSNTARFIDVTRQLMSDFEQEMLGTLAIPPAGFTHEQARQLVGASPFFLLALLERSLLRREGSRYTVHAAIAERYRAGLRDPEAARKKVVNTWVGLARRISEHRDPALIRAGRREIDFEESNLRFVWDQLLAEPEAELFWPLIKVLRGFLDARGRRREGRELFTAAAAVLEQSDDLELRGYILEGVALFLAQNAQFEEAQQRIDTSIGLMERHGVSGDSLALAWNTKGIIYGLQENDEDAIVAFRKSAEIRAADGDAFGEAQALGNVAVCLSFMHPPAEAVEHLQDGVERYRAVGDLSGAAMLEIRQADLMYEHGLASLEECIRLLEAAFSVVLDGGAAQSIISGGQQLARVLEAAGRHLEAADALGHAADWARIEERFELEATVRAWADRLLDNERSG